MCACTAPTVGDTIVQVKHSWVRLVGNRETHRRHVCTCVLGLVKDSWVRLVRKQRKPRDGTWALRHLGTCVLGWVKDSGSLCGKTEKPAEHMFALVSSGEEPDGCS